MKSNTTTARVYVGTYGKYNAGSIKGEWFDLEDYADKADFLQACADLHADETDPEFMFQDWEGLPADMIGESWIDENAFQWISLDDDDRELITVYREAIGNEFPDIESEIEAARDAFQGTADTEAEFAERTAEELGEIPENLPTWICIDWQQSWDSGLQSAYSTHYHNGEIWFFLNH